MKINLDWESIQKQVVDLATTSFRGYIDQALADFKVFQKASEENISQYLIALKSGTINQEEFKDLLQGERDLLIMESLKEAGLGQIALDKFANDVIKLIITAASSVIVL